MKSLLSASIIVATRFSCLLLSSRVQGSTSFLQPPSASKDPTSRITCSASVFGVTTRGCKTMSAREPINLDSQTEVDKVLAGIDYVLTDCDGVIYLNNEIIPGTTETFNLLRKRGKKVIFASNNSSKSRRSILKKLNKMGFNATLEEVVVTSFVAGQYLKALNFKGKVYVFGCQGISDELNEVQIKNEGVGAELVPADFGDNLVPNVTLDPTVEATVVAFDNQISLPKLIKACTYSSRVQSHLFIATNDDETLPVPDPNILVPGTGAFVNFVRTCVGREPVFMGKPGTRYFEAIRSVHPDINPKRTLMIGDRLNTDIAFGNNNKLGYSLLVETGVHSMADVRKIQKTDRKEDQILIPSHYLTALSDVNKYL